jgi:hypothetical protein
MWAAESDSLRQSRSPSPAHKDLGNILPLFAFRPRGEDAMLRDEQVAVLCDIAQSIAFADDMKGEVDRLIIEGYVARNGDLYELTPKAEKILSERGAALNES